VKADLGGLELISEELFIKSGAKTQGNGPLNSAAISRAALLRDASLM
jgi:hypothetical protein